MRLLVASMRLGGPTTWSSLLPDTAVGGSLAVDFFPLSFSVLLASYRVMSTVAGTSDGAGADETTIFSPEQLCSDDSHEWQPRLESRPRPVQPLSFPPHQLRPQQPSVSILLSQGPGTPRHSL